MTDQSAQNVEPLSDEELRDWKELLDLPAKIGAQIDYIQHHRRVYATIADLKGKLAFAHSTPCAVRHDP